MDSEKEKKMDNQVSVNDTAADAARIAENEFSAAVSETAENSVPPKKKKRRINQQKLQDNLWGWAFCLPLLIGTIWFVYAALIMALMLSFTGYRLQDGMLTEYLANLGDHIYQNQGWYTDPVTGQIIELEATLDPFHWYKQIFTQEVLGVGGTSINMNEMGMYLFNTVFYMIGIPIGMILAMFFAVCMSRDIKGGSVFRVLYYVPCVASTISIVFTFKLMFQQEGVINQILGTNIAWLKTFGPETWNHLYRPDNPSPSDFMNNPFWCQGFLSKIVIVIMSVWKGLGGTIILYIAGLSGVNAATKEAAQIDGASGWKIFWKVTMPDLYPVIFYNIVTSVIGGLQIYAEPELFIPNADPMIAGYVALVYKYGIGGSNTSPAAGAAYGLFLAVIIFILTLFQFWLDSRNKD